MIKLLILLLFFSNLTLQAQFPEFYVDLYVGDIQLIKAGQKKALPVKPRMLLFAGDKLIIKKEGNRISLVNKENKYLELNRKGDFNVSDISKMTFADPHSVTKKYFELVWEELLDPGAISAKDKGKKITGTWGGVIRGNCNKSEIPFDNSVSSDYWINFSWKAMPNVNRYRFSLYNERDILIHQYLISDTSFSIGAKGYVSNPSNIYYWQVEANDDPARVTCKAKLRWITAVEYKRQTDEIINSFDKSDSRYFLNVSIKLFDSGFYSLAEEFFWKQF